LHDKLRGMLLGSRSGKLIARGMIIEVYALHLLECCLRVPAARSKFLEPAELRVCLALSYCYPNRNNWNGTLSYFAVVERARITLP